MQFSYCKFGSPVRACHWWKPWVLASNLNAKSWGETREKFVFQQIDWFFFLFVMEISLLFCLCYSFFSFSLCPSFSLCTRFAFHILICFRNISSSVIQYFIGVKLCLLNIHSCTNTCNRTGHADSWTNYVLWRYICVLIPQIEGNQQKISFKMKWMYWYVHQYHHAMFSVSVGTWNRDLDSSKFMQQNAETYQKCSWHLFSWSEIGLPW